jgi:anti-anti-sigma factor
MTAPVPVYPVLRELGCITVGREGDTEVLRLVGDIDTDAVIAYEQSGVSNGRVISVVDLKDVTFLSSTGLALVIRQTQSARERGDVPVLRGLTARDRRLLQMTGIAGLFHDAS